MARAKPAAQPMPAASMAKVPESRAGAKVTVASKLPMALELQLCEFRDTQMKNGNNAWVEKVAFKTGQIVTVAGTAYPSGQPPAGMPERPTMVAGCALTSNVDADFFAAWMEQNKDSPMVRNKLIYAHENLDNVRGFAKDTKDVHSGLQPLTPDTDRRMPKKISGGKVATSVEALAEAE